jgi:hypothetical protein
MVLHSQNKKKKKALFLTFTFNSSRPASLVINGDNYIIKN